MKLGEAIIHAEETAEEIENACEHYEIAGVNASNGRRCASEHRQLAEWLKELKEYREKGEPKGLFERNKERILQAGMEGREVELRIGGRLFAIREVAQ